MVLPTLGMLLRAERQKGKNLEKRKKNTVSVTAETRNYLQTPVNPSKAMCTSEPNETIKQITNLKVVNCKTNELTFNMSL